MSNSTFAEQVRVAIPAEFHMISGSHDSQTSADVQNVGKFNLPNPAGKVVVCSVPSCVLSRSTGSKFSICSATDQWQTSPYLSLIF